MTTKVIISIPGTELRGIEVIAFMGENVSAVQEIYPGQSAEMCVHEHQQLHIIEIDPDAISLDEAFGSPAPSAEAVEVLPVGTVGTATEIIPGAIQVPPADLNVPLMVDSAVRINGDGSEFTEPVSMAEGDAGFETKTYADGSTACGHGPLPDHSPAEQEALSPAAVAFLDSRESVPA